MTAQGADFLYTAVLLLIGLLLLWALVNLVQVLFVRIQADHHAETFGEAYLRGRRQHRTDVRQAIRRTQRAAKAVRR